MQLIKTNNLTKLIAENGYVLKEKKVQVEEMEPYFFKVAYVPNGMTLDKAKELYEEVKEENANVCN